MSGPCKKCKFAAVCLGSGFSSVIAHRLYSCEKAANPLAYGQQENFTLRDLLNDLTEGCPEHWRADPLAALRDKQRVVTFDSL